MKKIAAFLITFLMLSTLCLTPSHALWDGVKIDTSLSGEGTSSSPYLITSEKEFAGFSYMSNHTSGYGNNKYFKLTRDLNLGEHPWSSINSFSGHFDGDGHTVSGLVSEGGLFGRVSGSVSNMTISGRIHNTDTSEDYAYCGGIADYLSGSIRNCKNECEIISDVTCAGGIVGYAAKYSNISNCVNIGNISGSKRIGGIAGSYWSDRDSGGHDEFVSISHCMNYGNISALRGLAGGIIGGPTGRELGSIYMSVVISDCGNSGSVTADSYAGGIIGIADPVATNRSYADGCIHIERCANSGDIHAQDNAGGIAGYLTYRKSKSYHSTPTGYGGGWTHYSSDTKLYNCYNSGSISGNQKIGGIIGNTSGGYLGSVCYGNIYSVGQVSAAGEDVDPFASGSLSSESNPSPIDIFYLWNELPESLSKFEGVYTLGKTDNDLRLEETYTSAGFSFGSVWTWDAGSYPYPILKSVGPLPNSSSSSYHPDHCICGNKCNNHTHENLHWVGIADDSLMDYACTGLITEKGIGYSSMKSGNYFLSDHLTLTEDLYIPSGVTVNLCLNGKNITGTGNAPVITICPGGTLNLTDCTAEYGTITGGCAPLGGGICNLGSMAMYSGKITGNSAQSGSGVYNAGTFILGGDVTITGNQNSGLWLSDGTVITLKNTVSESTDIDITVEAQTGAITDGWSDYGIPGNIGAVFTIHTNRCVWEGTDDPSLPRAEITVGPHNPGEKWFTDDSRHHWKICSQCGIKINQEEHDYGAWSPSDSGLWSHTCSVCGRVESELHVGDSLCLRGTPNGENLTLWWNTPQYPDSVKLTGYHLIAVNSSNVEQSFHVSENTVKTEIVDYKNYDKFTLRACFTGPDGTPIQSSSSEFVVPKTTGSTPIITTSQDSSKIIIKNTWSDTTDPCTIDVMIVIANYNSSGKMLSITFERHCIASGAQVSVPLSACKGAAKTTVFVLNPEKNIPIHPCVRL